MANSAGQRHDDAKKKFKMVGKKWSHPVSAGCDLQHSRLLCQHLSAHGFAEVIVRQHLTFSR